MTFIRLIQVFTGSSEQKPVFVNPVFVTSVRPTGADTIVEFVSGSGVRVRETPEQIVEMLEHADWLDRTEDIDTGADLVKENIAKELEREQHR